MLLAALSISGFTQTLWINFHIKYFDVVDRETNKQTNELVSHVPSVKDGR